MHFLFIYFGSAIDLRNEVEILHDRFFEFASSDDLPFIDVLPHHHDYQIGVAHLKSRAFTYLLLAGADLAVVIEHEAQQGVRGRDIAGFESLGLIEGLFELLSLLDDSLEEP